MTCLINEQNIYCLKNLLMVGLMVGVVIMAITVALMVIILSMVVVIALGARIASFSREGSSPESPGLLAR